VSKPSSHLKVVSSDQRACTVVLKGTAPMTDSHGTGKYRGIHGTLSITVVNGVVFPTKKTSGCVQNINKAVRLTRAAGSGQVSL